MQFWLSDDEHMCSKRVETWNKLIVKKNLCARLVGYWDKYTHITGYSWKHGYMFRLFLSQQQTVLDCWDKYTEIHGQQNFKKPVLWV